MSNSQSENRNSAGGSKSFWKTVALFHIYFIFFYMLVLVIFSRFTVSALLLLVPILTIAMVPLAQKGLRASKAKKMKNEILPALGFLTLFALTKLIMIFSLHDAFNAFHVVDFESSAIDIIVAGIFLVLFALSIFFLITSDSWTNRFIFIILTVYSLARVLEPFGIMPGVTHWILQYLTLAALLLILGAVFIKSKLSGRS